MVEVRPRRTEAPEVRRRQILDAARRCFRASGIHSAKMSDVAAEAGVSVGMIYQYFAGKDELIEGLVRDNTENQVAGVMALLDQEPANLREAVKIVSDSFRNAAIDREQMALMLELAAETTRNARLRKFVADLQASFQPVIRERFAGLKPASWSFEEFEARFDFFFWALQGELLRHATQAQAPTPELAALFERSADWLFASAGEGDAPPTEA